MTPDFSVSPENLKTYLNLKSSSLLGTCRRRFSDRNTPGYTDTLGALTAFKRSRVEFPVYPRLPEAVVDAAVQWLH
jgi:hypothetical protein